MRHARARTILARKAVIGLVILMLLAPHWAIANSYDADQQRAWLPSPRNEAFTGEITYDFDSVLNLTTATFVAPLGKRDLLHRLFSTPTVHTIVVSYQSSGRVAAHLPDTIRVRLESDDYVDPISSGHFVVLTDPTLNIGVGDRIEQHSLSISQHVQLETQPRGISEDMVVTPGRQQFVRVFQTQWARISRQATAWLSRCEFLSMIEQTEIRGTVGGLDFELNHLVVAGLNRFAAEMLPADSQRFTDCAR